MERMEHAIRRKEIIDVYISHRNGRTLDQVIADVITQHQQEHGHTNTMQNGVLRLLKHRFNSYWQKSARTADSFRKKHQIWLNGEIKLDKPDAPLEDIESSDSSDDRHLPGQTGRPSEPFSSLSERSKRRKTEDLRSHYSAEELAYGSQMNFRKDGNINASKVCKEIIATPTRSSKLYSKLQVPIETKFTPSEALAVIVNTNLSKDSYVYLRKEHKKRNCNIYPSYSTILQEKQKCYPGNISADEFKVFIPLQALVNHTTNRLLVAQQSALDIIAKRQNENTTILELLWKCGLDGSGCHSVYDIKYDEGRYNGISEENIFSAFVCPLRLYVKGSKTLLWNNPVPSSPIYCRPLRVIFQKETATLIRSEWESLKAEIDNLVTTHTNNYEIHHKIILTMVDGKICQALTNTPSAATCYMCCPPTNPSSMNALDAIIAKEIRRECLSYGIVPLHLYINTMECVLHISYRLKLKSWAVKGEENKKIMTQEKKRIQKELKQQLGINVDKPAQGAGNTNCGNTARRFFEAYELVSQITGVNMELISRFSVLLTALNSSFDINPEKYKAYALATAQLYVSKYQWYYMPLSVHKMLLHGAEVIEELCIPVGQSSEEGMEGKHKDLRRVRLHHTCKTSRVRINEDLIHWLLIMSDPIIASQREVKRANRKPLHPDVIELLQEPNIYNESDSDHEVTGDDNIGGAAFTDDSE